MIYCIRHQTLYPGRFYDEGLQYVKVVQPTTHTFTKLVLRSKISDTKLITRPCIPSRFPSLRVCRLKNCKGGLLYQGSLRFLQFSAAVFRFFTIIGAVFRFCRLLRFAEMDVFSIRFSAFSHLCSGFSVFEKYAVCGYSLPYCGLLIFGSLFQLVVCCYSPPYLR